MGANTDAGLADEPVAVFLAAGLVADLVLVAGLAAGFFTLVTGCLSAVLAADLGLVAGFFAVD